MNHTCSGVWYSQLESQQVYTDEWTEVGHGREGRRGVAGASEGIYTPEFAFLQSACFHSSATPSCLAYIALKRHKALPSDTYILSLCLAFFLYVMWCNNLKK